ncbi:MAG: HEAT repeat domain-containing protein [Methanomicrobiales archaeon]|nr:HEAT repeat domain-containing protein [Methanomicrobiales archaeon]
MASGNVQVNPAITNIIRILKRSRNLGEIERVYGGSQEEMITSLIQILGTDEITLRWKAAVALHGIGKPAVACLLSCLDDVKSSVRGSVAWILGTIGDPAAVDRLIPLLADESDEVRRETAEALGKIGDIRAQMPLSKVVDDKNKTVRVAAVEALKAIQKN